MKIIEQELAAVERQCAEAMVVVGSGTANVAVALPPSFFVGVQKLSAAYRKLHAQPDPTGRDEKLKTSLDNHRRMLQKIATMKRIDANQEAAMAAQSFLDSHPAS
jgi:hypothetical protein